MEPQLFAKLKWQCRRGTKELDSLLESFLINNVNPTNTDLFIDLLSLQDSQLISFLLGERRPESTELATLVKQIRNNTNV